MPELAPGKTVETSRPVLEVTNSFAPGTYHFRLVVVDDAGNESSPATVAVTVAAGRVTRPTPTPVVKDTLLERLKDKLPDLLGKDVKIDPKVNPRIDAQIDRPIEPKVAVRRPIKPLKPS